MLGGFSRVTQFVRSQLGLGGDLPAGEVIEEATIPEGEQSLQSVESGSLQPAGTPTASIVPSQISTDTEVSSEIPVDSLLLARTACPLSSLANNEDETPEQPAAAVQAQEENTVVVSEPTSSLTQQSLAVATAFAPVASNEEATDMFESARSDVVSEEPVASVHSSAQPAELETFPSLEPANAVCALLLMKQCLLKYSRASSENPIRIKLLVQSMVCTGYSVFLSRFFYVVLSWIAWCNPG